MQKTLHTATEIRHQPALVILHLVSWLSLAIIYLVTIKQDTNLFVIKSTKKTRKRAENWARWERRLAEN